MCNSMSDVSNYAYFPIVVKNRYKVTRNQLYDVLKINKIHARKYFYPLTSDQACFKNKYKKCELKNARELADQVLVLPLYERLEKQTIRKILDVVTRTNIDNKIMDQT